MEGRGRSPQQAQDPLLAPRFGRKGRSPQQAQDPLLAPRFGRKETVTTTSARSTLGSEVWKEGGRSPQLAQDPLLAPRFGRKGTVTTTSARSTLGSQVWKEGDGHHNKRKIHSWLRGLEGRGRSPQQAQDPLLAPRFGRKGTVTTTSARSTLGSEVWKEGDGHHNKRKIHSCSEVWKEGRPTLGSEVWKEGDGHPTAAQENTKCSPRRQLTFQASALSKASLLACLLLLSLPWVSSKRFTVFKDGSAYPCIILDMDFTILVNNNWQVPAGQQIFTAEEFTRSTGSCESETERFIELHFKPESHLLFEFLSEGQGGESQVTLRPSFLFEPDLMFPGKATGDKVCYTGPARNISDQNSSYKCFREETSLYGPCTKESESSSSHFTVQVMEHTIQVQAFGLTKNGFSPAITCVGHPSKVTAGLIAAIVVGVFAFIAIMAGVVAFIVLRKRTPFALN